MQLGTWLTILKARQVGISWLLAAYMLWLALYRPGSLILAISKSQSDSDELLAKCRALYDNLDSALLVAITRHSTASPARLEFANDSRIMTVARA